MRRPARRDLLLRGCNQVCLDVLGKPEVFNDSMTRGGFHHRRTAITAKDLNLFTLDFLLRFEWI